MLVKLRSVLLLVPLSSLLLLLATKNLSPLSGFVPPLENVGTGVRVTEVAELLVVVTMLLLEFRLARSGLNLGGSSFAS